MSIQYGKIPPGGIVNMPPSIPTGMLYRVKSLSGISKQTLKWFHYRDRQPFKTATKLL